VSGGDTGVEVVAFMPFPSYGDCGFTLTSSCLFFLEIDAPNFPANSKDSSSPVKESGDGFVYLTVKAEIPPPNSCRRDAPFFMFGQRSFYCPLFYAFLRLPQMVS